MLHPSPIWYTIDEIVDHEFQTVTDIKFIVCWTLSLVVKLGQLVAGDNHVLHPSFRDDHKVSHASADVVSAHGESQSCDPERSKGRTEQGGDGQQAGQIKV